MSSSGVNRKESPLKSRPSQYAYEQRRLYSHYETLLPHITSKLNRGVKTPGVPWRVELNDPKSGSIPVVGILHDNPGADRLIVLIHGLGSDPNAGYVRTATDGFMSMGYAVLRLAFRGATGEAPDFYNAALTAGLHAALADERITAYDTRYVMGFSLGGHMALRCATEISGNEARGVVAICPPLSLEGCQINLDRARVNLYRRHCLQGLRRTVRRAAEQARLLGRQLDVDLDALDGIKTFREWDGEVVARRFDYDGADDYYARASAGPVLHQLKIPALIVGTRFDPMVPIETITPYVGVPKVHSVISERGGHVGFPQDVDLGLGPNKGLVAQVHTWLDQCA